MTNCLKNDASPLRCFAPWNQQKVVDAYAGPKKVISMTGGHNDGVPADAYKQLDADLDWLVAQRR